MWVYVVSYLLLVLITDHSGYQDSFIPIAKVLRKSPFLGKLLRCSLCVTFWMSLCFVLFTDVPYWVLLLPWLSSTVSGLIGLLFDMFACVINKIGSWL